MCGIIGYIGKNEAAPIVLDGLKKLEYRGYDSVGIALKDNNNIIIKKGIGKIDEFASGLNLESLKGNIGMGHSRWATHGKVTEENSHPHLSNNGKIAVVHNGIIENYQEQKKFLESKNYKFISETDTEVIPNTIQYHMERGYDFIEACKHALNHIEGSYAIVIMNRDEDRIVAVRKESPLVLGVGNGEYFIASDIPAFIEYTKNVVFLNEKEMLILSKDEYKIFDLKTNLYVDEPVQSIEWNIEQAKKGNFDHFMLKEISEQAETINKAISQDEKIIKEVAEKIKKAKGVYFVGCGTAFHACLSAMYKFSNIAKRHVNVALGSEFPNYIDFLTPESLVIAVSQSGETADTLSAIRAAKEKGAKVISVVNAIGSSLARESDYTLLQRAGPEISVLSTKSYTSQLAILTLLTYALVDKYEEGKAKLKELINYIYYLTSLNTRKHIQLLADKLRYAHHLYLIGRGLQYPTAMEAALKIKEVSYIHAEAYAGGELKHGTIALIEHGTPCIVFTSEKNEKETISNAMELKARGAYIIGVGPKKNEVFDFFIKVREAEEMNSICQIIPIQILAYQLALLRGCDPDKPRNLAKSVTVK